jgi:neutral ceramidase
VLEELDSVPVELQRLELGDATFVAVPGEIFSDAQSALDAALPERRVRIVAPANGYLGYFPSAEAYDHGGYEIGVSLVERGSAEQLVDVAVGLVRAEAGAYR